MIQLYASVTLLSTASQYLFLSKVSKRRNNRNAA